MQKDKNRVSANSMSCVIWVIIRLSNKMYCLQPPNKCISKRNGYYLELSRHPRIWRIMHWNMSELSLQLLQCVLYGHRRVGSHSWISNTQVLQLSWSSDWERGPKWKSDLWNACFSRVSPMLSAMRFRICSQGGGHFCMQWHGNEVNFYYAYNNKMDRNYRAYQEEF